MRVICTESCRLFSPPELIGDYVKGWLYDNPRLVEEYSSLFRGEVTHKEEIVIESTLESLIGDAVPANDSTNEETAISVEPDNKKKKSKTPSA